MTRSRPLRSVSAQLPSTRLWLLDTKKNLSTMDGYPNLPVDQHGLYPKAPDRSSNFSVMRSDHTTMTTYGNFSPQVSDNVVAFSPHFSDYSHMGQSGPQPSTKQGLDLMGKSFHPEQYSNDGHFSKQFQNNKQYTNGGQKYTNGEMFQNNRPKYSGNGQHEAFRKTTQDYSATYINQTVPFSQSYRTAKYTQTGTPNSNKRPLGGTTYKYATKYPQGPVGVTPLESACRLPTVKEGFDWLSSMPDFSTLQQQLSQENITDAIHSGANFDPDLTEQVIKLEQASPTQANRFSFSRTSSTGSIHAVCGSSASSTHNTVGDIIVIASPETTEVTDDEDSDSTKPPNLKERRREAHTQAEQKRRDAIKKGYDDLQMLVPTCQQTETVGSTKLSKASVLQKSIDYMQYLLQQKRKQEDDLESLRKEVTALKIMKANYEHIVKAHNSTPQHGQNQISDEMKFTVYQKLMDSLFLSFNSSISVANFAELSGSIFRWLEEYCKPQLLRSQTEDILKSELSSSQQ